MAEVRTCIYLSQRDQSESPPGTAAEVVYETLVMPAMEYYPDFRMNPRGYIHEPGSISDQLIDEMLSAELVIADLTDLSGSGYFQLGVRHSAQLPTVFILDQDFVIPLDAREFRVLRYPYEHSPSSPGDRDTIDGLVQAIREALDTPPRGSHSTYLPTNQPPRERRYELARRIEDTADLLNSLRINSTGEVADELRTIADELRDVEDEETPSVLSETVEKVLNVLARILDQLDSVRGARLAISGVVGLIVGGAGMSGVAAFGMSLAFWEGKATFLKAIEALGRKNKK